MFSVFSSRYRISLLFLFTGLMIWSACNKGKNDYEQLLSEIEAIEQGDSTVSLEKTDSLMAKYARFAVTYPEHERSELFLYKALKYHYFQGMYAQSEEESQAYLRLFPQGMNKRQVLINLAMLEGLQKNNPKEALRLFEEAGMTEPSIAEQSALYSVYEAWYKQNPGDTASAAYLYRAAGGWNNLEEFDRCISLCDTLVLRFPESKFAPKALFLKAFTAENSLQDVKLAEQSYRDLVRRYPQDSLSIQAKMILDQNLLGMDAAEMLQKVLKKKSS